MKEPDVSVSWTVMQKLEANNKALGGLVEAISHSDITGNPGEQLSITRHNLQALLNMIYLQFENALAEAWECGETAKQKETKRASKAMTA